MEATSGESTFIVDLRWPIEWITSLAGNAGCHGFAPGDFSEIYFLRIGNKNGLCDIAGLYCIKYCVVAYTHTHAQIRTLAHTPVGG